MGSRILIPVLAVGFLGLAVGGYLIEQRGDGQSPANRGLEINVPPPPAPPGPFDDWGRPDGHHLRAALALIRPFEELEDTGALYSTFGEPGVPYPPALVTALRKNVEMNRGFHELLSYALSQGPVAIVYPEDHLLGLQDNADSQLLSSAHDRTKEALSLALAEKDGARVMALMRVRMDLVDVRTNNPNYNELFRLSKEMAHIAILLEQALSRTELSPSQVGLWSAWMEQFDLNAHLTRCMKAEVTYAQWRKENYLVAIGYQTAHRLRMQAHILEDEDPELTLHDRVWLLGAADKLLPATEQRDYEQQLAHTIETLAILKDADRLTQRERRAELRELMAQDLPHNQMMYAAVQTLLFAHTNKTLAEAGLRAELYRLEHGDWPQGIDDLGAPGLIDPWSDQPLKLKQTEHGAVIYSIGPNEIDDNGYGQDHDDHTNSERIYDDFTFVLLDPASRNMMLPESEF